MPSAIDVLVSCFLAGSFVRNDAACHGSQRDPWGVLRDR